MHNWPSNWIHKFHWVCRDVRWTAPIIKKMTDFWKIVLDCRKYWKCVDGGSWVSLALLTWLRNYKVFYFGSFIEFDVMSEERPELSRNIPSIIWSLATLCDTLITFRENHWLLRLIWRFSESVSEYESVFRIFVWIIIHRLNSVLI